MIDINFYRKSYGLLSGIQGGESPDLNGIRQGLEELRSEDPVVYNIETTNACNMRCKMCPRTRMMTRPVETLDIEVFRRIVDQLRPWTAEEWKQWEEFVVTTYQIRPGDMSENHFFLYIIPRVIQLHGYGDPLLDRNIVEAVQLLTGKGMESYFSCNPANIDIDAMVRLFKAGLGYIKYSIESVDDEKHREIRGKASNFSESYQKIRELLRIKKENNYKTTIVITMLDLNHSWQQEEYEKLEKLFDGLDVYIYLKSEDQQWYRQDYHGTNSIHWSEICKHPWMSMTIKSNGEAAMCMEDFNNEIILGDASRESLYDIWHGEKYRLFREKHLLNSQDMKCTRQCDMPVVGSYFK